MPATAITWERVRGVFGDAQPPKTVWERQFDYCDAELWRLAKAPYEQIDFGDLWYYYHDLAYVELQPDLFAYLFPVCLMDWHRTLMRNEECAHGDAEFHSGVFRGNVFDKMLTANQCLAVYEFFRDSLLERIDVERGFIRSPEDYPAYGWIARFNSLAMVMPRIDLIWNAWWRLDTPGRAVTALQYCSWLMYLEGENPLFDAFVNERGADGVFLRTNDSRIWHSGWRSENVAFLQKTLSWQFVSSSIAAATNRLRGEPEQPLAEQVLRDLRDRRELIEARAQELPGLLQTANGKGWSI